MTAKIVFHHDVNAEFVLAEKDLKWTIVTIDVASVDVEASLRNHGRFRGSVNDDQVANLASKIDLNDTMPIPRIVVVKRGDKYIIIGGNHRFAAFKKVGFTTIEAYLVDCEDDITLSLVASRLNSGEGRGETTTELACLAAKLIGEKAMSEKEASRHFSVKIHSIRAEMNRSAVRARCESLDIKFNDENLGVRKLGVLNQKGITAPIFRKLYEFALVSTDEELANIRNKSNTLESSESDQVACIQSAIDLKSKRSGRRYSTKEHFNRAITRAESVLNDNRSFTSLGVGDIGEKEEYRRRLVALRDKIDTLIGSA